MCHNTANIDANIENMNAVASEMSEIQKNANAPLLDMLFKLAEHPQTDNLNPKRVKTLHEYAHKLLDFYMTECPDITSIRVINTTAVHDIATKLRTLSDGLARLLRYLGMNEDAAALTNLTSALANAYNMFGAAMAKAQHALDEFDDCDCDCDCDCDAEDNCEEDEEDEEGEEDGDDNGGDDAEEQARKLFERIFGFNPNVLRKSEDKAQPQPQPKPEENQHEKARKEVEELLDYLLGCKPEAPKPAPEKATKPNAEDGSLEKLLASMLASEIAPCRSPLMTIHGVHPGLWRLF